MLFPRHDGQSNSRAILTMLSFLILLHVVYQFSLQSHILFQEETQNSVNFPPLLQKQSSKWPTAKNATLYYFDAESVEPENSIWVVKWISKKLFLGDKCDYLVQRIQKSQKKTSNSPVILIVDRGDSSSFHKSNCPERIASLVGPQNQYLAMRNLVNNRNFGCMSITAPTCYSETQLFTDLYGEPWNYSLQPFTKHIHNGCIAKVDFPVRESLLNDIEARLGHEDIDQFRTKGVGHFWNIEPGDKYGQLRNRVTQTIQEFLENSTTITGTAGLVSTRGRSGRVFVSERYVDALLEHKIVVVCQRDHWEGHLRLMEALVSGGLVLTDPIMHMPAGFVDGENIVIYNSLKDLKNKIGYYLSPGGTRARKTIATAGRRLAIEHHKAEHMFQRLAYGRWPRDAASPVIDIV